jgi:hypothetical protein
VFRDVSGKRPGLTARAFLLPEWRPENATNCDGLPQKRRDNRSPKARDGGPALKTNDPHNDTTRQNLPTKNADERRKQPDYKKMH